MEENGIRWDSTVGKSAWKTWQSPYRLFMTFFFKTVYGNCSSPLRSIECLGILCTETYMGDVEATSCSGIFLQA